MLSVPGNGNNNDNSLDGFIGRVSAIGVLGTGLTNPFIESKARNYIPVTVKPRTAPVPTPRTQPQQVQQVQPEPQVQQVQPEPQVQQVQPEPQVQQVQPEPQAQQVQPEPQVQQVQQVQPGEPSFAQDAESINIPETQQEAEIVRLSNDFEKNSENLRSIYDDGFAFPEWFN